MQLLKGTSLASIIGFTELTRAAAVVNNATFRPFIVYATGRRALLRALLAAVAACRTFRAPTWAASVARARSGSHAGADVSRRRICSLPCKALHWLILDSIRIT